MSDTVDDTVAPIGADGGTRLKWTLGAQYRLGKLAEPPSFEDLRKPGLRFFAALCDFVWASQVDGPFKAPADVAEALNNKNIPEVAAAMTAAFLESRPPEDDPQKKNTRRSVKGRGPGKR